MAKESLTIGDMVDCIDMSELHENVINNNLPYWKDAILDAIKKTEEEVRIEIESNPYFKVNISRNRRIFYIKMFEYAKREGRLLDCLEFRIEQEKNQAGCDVATVDLRGVYDFFKA